MSNKATNELYTALKNGLDQAGIEYIPVAMLQIIVEKLKENDLFIYQGEIKNIQEVDFGGMDGYGEYESYTVYTDAEES